MAETTEANSESFTSPSAAAPILVGFDGAEGGRDALELARVLSTIRGSSTVIASPDAEHLSKEARDVLGESLAEIRVIGVLSPAPMLVQCAEREGAGSLVVGSPRHGRVGRALLGSTAEQVLHRAPCEVIVAPRGYASETHHELAKVAVAVDGTPVSEAALTRGEELAREAGATLEVLVASDLVVADVEAEQSDVLEAAISSIDPALSPTGRRVDSGRRPVARTIADALAEACKSAVDLLVVGSPRQRDRFFPGSVTKHLISEAPCPVLVVPHPKQ